jgi:hypothetical protein
VAFAECRHQLNQAVRGEKPTNQAPEPVFLYSTWRVNIFFVNGGDNAQSTWIYEPTFEK